MMMDFSYALRNFWWLILIAIFGMVYAGKRFFGTERGALFRDKTLLSLPIFGKLIRQRVVARFASTLSTLLGSGLSMAESLRVVAQVTGNAVMSKSVRQARDRILSGADIATPLRESGVIDPATTHMISVGEKSGELETMLNKISESLESSSDVVIERISAATEPLIIVVMALIVGIIAYATILPILQFSSGKM
jgi:type II secretory pathway component PulF